MKSHKNYILPFALVSLWTVPLSAQDEVDLAIEQAETYLYDPASPYRDEEKYIIFLEQLIADPNVPEVKKIRPRHQLSLVLKNRRGEKATDFNYTTREGVSRSLYDTPVDSLLLVIFFDPECPHCMETMESAYAITREKNIPVLAVYTEGKEDVWGAMKDTLPPEWTVAIDCSGILANTLYDLIAMPTMYLLDADKQVLQKDITLQQLNN